MKRVIKKMVQAPVSALTPFLWRRRRDPALLVLMYHRVLPTNHPDRRTEQPGMYVAPETLAMHIEVLRRHFELVHLDDWVTAGRESASVPRNACAVTFDDGWLDNYEHAFPVLRKFQCPATIYLVSDLVGTRYEFWPNRLSELLVSNRPVLQDALPEWLAAIAHEQGLLRPQLPVDYIERVDAVVNACKTRCSDADMIALLDRIQSPTERGNITARRNLMTWSEIREMGAGDLIRFGSHSRRHTRLTAKLASDALADEIVQSKNVIEQNLGKAPRTFCYPNGDYSDAALSAVRKTYEAAVTTRRGWNAVATDRFLLNRVGVHDDITNSRTGFVARIGAP